jgi:nicotinamidase-related amidase
MKCLLVIDMQKGLFKPNTPRYNSKHIINNINRLSECFRNKAYPVIFIQHNGASENNFIPGTSDYEIIDELNINENDYIIEKYANDSFYNSVLDETLKNLKIKELFITGCATDFCVNSTLQSAYTKEYQITVASDGHTTTDRLGIKSNIVIDYYNWLWQNITPVNRKIILSNTELIINSF